MCSKLRSVRYSDTFLDLIAQLGTASNEKRTAEAGCLLSFLYETEEAASVVERSRGTGIVPAVSGADEATQGWAWTPLASNRTYSEGFWGCCEADPGARSARPVLRRFLERPHPPFRGQTQVAPITPPLEIRGLAAELPPHPVPLRPHP